MYSPCKAHKLFLTRLFSFQGRSTRAELWWVMLFVWPIQLFLQVLVNIAENSYSTSYLVLPFSIVSIVIGITCLAISVRRLHDLDMSGWWILLSLIPFVGLILIVFYCLPSQHKTNKYGADPTADPQAHYDYYMTKQHKVSGPFYGNAGFTAHSMSANAFAYDFNQQAQGLSPATVPVQNQAPTKVNLEKDRY